MSLSLYVYSKYNYWMKFPLSNCVRSYFYSSRKQMGLHCFDVTGSYLDLHANLSSYFATLYSTSFGIYNIGLLARIIFVEQYRKDGEVENPRCDKKSNFSKLSILRTGQIDINDLTRWLIIVCVTSINVCMPIEDVNKFNNILKLYSNDGW